MQQETIERKQNISKEYISKTYNEYEYKEFKRKQYTGLKVGRSHKRYFDK